MVGNTLVSLPFLWLVSSVVERRTVNANVAGPNPARASITLTGQTG